MKLRHYILPSLFLFALNFGCSTPSTNEDHVTTSTTSRAWSAVPKEQLYGAEIQYFRLRGGMGPNLPRQKVLDLWARALDAAKAAKMNTVSFYVPWDFHEYQEGKFDFDGMVDEDQDGRPDYPSRDVKTFIKMIEERGFKHVMVRPGPYINAEWGYLGFGAVPMWFHNKYPESHMMNPQGLRTKLFDYHNPDLLRRTEIWLNQVNAHLILPNLGANKPVRFLQVDNETNFLWQSIYNHDYSPSAKSRYRAFLKKRYSDLAKVNAAHNRSWTQWEDIQPPIQVGQNVPEDQDWYRFQDDSIYQYLKIVRGFWEKLGIHEPRVLYTVAESYNASMHGLLPNYKLRNDPKVGVLTVNMYPKVEETKAKPYLNWPFKIDHDVEAQNTASERYFGDGNQWVGGPEIQGGWWKGIPVSPQARMQTYLSAIGHGMKMLLVYYYNEGNNWQTDWAQAQIEPFYNQLKSQAKYQKLRSKNLPNEFWGQLQRNVDENLMVGFDVRKEMTADQNELAKLFFDAPLDGDAKPRHHYNMLKTIGDKLIAPHGAWLAQSVTSNDSVCLLKDVADHVPGPHAIIDNVKINSEWESGLIGYALHAGVNPEIIHWGIQKPERLNRCRIILHQDAGITNPEIAKTLDQLMQKGHVVVNFLASSLPEKLGLQVGAKEVFEQKNPTVAFGATKFRAAVTPRFAFELKNDSCKATLMIGSQVAGYRCSRGSGAFIQVGTLFHDVFNHESYTTTKDTWERTQLLRELLAEQKIVPLVEPSDTKDPVVAFGRHHRSDENQWITVKSGKKGTSQFRVKVSTVDPNKSYVVRDLLRDKEQLIKGSDLKSKGFIASLPALGSTVYWVMPPKEIR